MDELTPVPYGQDTSPFDRIAQTGPDGIRRWSGRDLMALMGYTSWQNFAPALDRARRSADRVGVDVTSHFMGSHKIVSRPQGGGLPQDDVLLTRYAAHLVAMNGDPGKVEVAAAQAYFSARTVQAEDAERGRPGNTVAALSQIPIGGDISTGDWIRLVTTAMNRLAEAEERADSEAAARAVAEAEVVTLDAKVQADAPKVAFVEEFVEPRQGAVTLRTFANQIGVRESHLRAYLIDHKLIYRRYDQCVRGNQYYPYAQYGLQDKAWFVSRAQPQAPVRLCDGRMPTTLDITPVGMVKVREMLQRRPIAGTDVWSDRPTPV